MKHYDGPSTTIDNEAGRSVSLESHSRSSLWSLIHVEKGLIKEFLKKGNTVIVELEDEATYTMTLKTPLELVLMLYGDVENLSNIPCFVFYRSTPDDGYVEFGDIGYDEITQEDKLVFRPFYL